MLAGQGLAIDRVGQKDLMTSNLINWKALPVFIRASGSAQIDILYVVRQPGRFKQLHNRYAAPAPMIGKNPRA